AAPEGDPWTSALAELVLLEALRWRFLAEAEAVAFLDVYDLMLPMPKGRSPLELLTEAEPALVPLTGRRIYPWKVPPDRAAGFGDHVCDQFDNPGGNRRWVAAPKRLPPDAPFRLVRIGGLTPDPLRAGFFLRAVALRVTEGPDMPLAPKAGLVLDQDLLALARDGFGADPVLPPVSAGSLGAKLPAALPGRTAIVTCMKNEGPFILEWIAHHRAIGVDDFLVYTNDCTDGTDTLLELLQEHGIVQHRTNPFREMPGVKPQHAALAAAEEEAVMARAGWAICMDVDEFIDVHVGGGHLRDLYRAVGDANMISLTWRLFGNADLATFEDELTPARFELSAPEVVRKPHQAWGFKTLFRNIGLYKKMGVHRPKGLKPDLWEDISWVNGSGRAMPKEMLRTGWRSTLETYGYDLVSLNHYAVRDAESFLVKRDRGRVNHVERDQGLGYWFRMNNNAEVNTSFRRHLPGLEAELARLKALPGVAEQHKVCVAAHRAKISELRASEAFASFYAEITGERMARLSRMHRHFGANVFLAGPDCVPDEVAFGEHGEGFFFTVKDVGEVVH
ncbi:MAG: glycosyltransferase family 2 protein, partial [Pseudomonadota bacterium]